MQLRILTLGLMLILCFPAYAFEDSVVAVASNKYKSGFAFRRIFVGNNYRATWELPVKMPVFNIDTHMGGMSITKLGGGAQTKSLRLQDKEGVEWVLRTVDKDVTKIVPSFLRGSIVHAVMQDIISTAYPYAPIVVGEFAEAINVQAPNPALYFVPDDPSFEDHRKDFANKVCMFEKLSPGLDNQESISTDSLYSILRADKNTWIDDSSFLKGRLLDLLIADWDRHKDQLKWGPITRKGKTSYYPIFRDRDQAFFYSDGMLLNKTRLFTLKHFTNFNKRSIRKIKRLSYKSWELDEGLLRKLSEDDWKRITQNFIHSLNDVVLQEAISKLPPEAYEKDGAALLSILKARRDGMLAPTMEYYRFLSDRIRAKGGPDSALPDLKPSKD